MTQQALAVEVPPFIADWELVASQTLGAVLRNQAPAARQRSADEVADEALLGC